MTTTRTGQLVHLNQHRQAELNGVGRDDHNAYVVTEIDDGTLVFTPAAQSSDPHLAQMSRPELEEMFRRDSSMRLEITGGPTPETAAVRLACLALGQAGFWGPPHEDLDVPHPRFAEAVGTAASLAPDEKLALDAATAILDGPDALKVFGFTA